MLRLYKKQKLCSTTAIDLLFSRDAASLSALSYPLRAVWRSNPGRKSDAPIQFLISVPKKKLRHAVDRVKMRRRIREAFRLNHQQYALPQGSRIDIAFVYVASELVDFGKVEHAMRKVLAHVAKACDESLQQL